MDRFFVDKSNINLENNTCVIVGEDVKHIKNVLRLKVDDNIQICNLETSINYTCGISKINSDNIENSIEAGEINIKIKGKIDLSQFVTPKQKSVRSDSKRNIYIIDTNVFVNYPDIISKIDSKYSVVLSAKVIDELDKLKITLDSDGKRNVEKALRNINKSLDSSNVTMELSDSSLLPLDFNKKSPDNNILSVALKFKDENPILLTSDNGLQVKAKGLKIATISLKEFLKR